MASNMWTSDRRLYLNAEGKAVEADDPTRIKLLVAAGGSIPLADAERYGLVTVTPAVVEAVKPQSDEKAKAPAANKAAAPKANK